MLISAIISQYAEIYHMAEDDSWLNIKEHGLLSTSALLDKWEYTSPERDTIECKLRQEKVRIYHKEYGEAVIRDQKAMHRERLKNCLTDGITVEEWCKFINKRVFFWADWIGLKILLSANEYIYQPHLVIAVDTERLLKQYGNKVTLSPINSGSTFPRKGKVDAEPRSFDTFQRIPEYHHRWINELAVDYAIPDIVDYINHVARYRMNKRGFENEPEKLEEIWP